MWTWLCERWRPLLVTALLALVLCCGGLWSGSTWWGLAASSGALALLAATGVGRGLDPLRLGRAKALPLLLLVTATVSTTMSAVPRASLTALLVLALALFAAGGLGSLLQMREASRVAFLRRALAVLLVATTVYGSVLMFSLGSSRLAAPLGHHNLMAAFFVVLLPIALVGFRADAGARWLHGAALLSGLGGLVAARSLSGMLAIGAVLLVALLAGPLRGFVRHFGWRRLLPLGVLAVVAIALFGPRLLEIARGTDASFSARLSYLEAGWRGLLERPIFGWGPGSSPWLTATHLEPVPGINPPGEVVTDLHSLPLQIGYELGVVGLLVVVVLALALAWEIARRPATSSTLAVDARLGAVGLAVLSLFGGFLTIPSQLGLSIFVLALFASDPERSAATARPVTRWQSARAVAAIVVLIGTVWLARVAFGARSYEKALRSETPAVELEAALGWDPAHPLYRARRSWIDGAESEDQNRRALDAARDAGGSSTLWLAAGLLGAGRGEPTIESLLRACELDPLSAIASFGLYLEGRRAGRDRALVMHWLARAVVAEPRLLASIELEGLDELQALLRDFVAAWPGTPELWRYELERTIAAMDWTAAGDVVPISLAFDENGSESPSVWMFRRKPWPTQLGGFPLRRSRLDAIDLPGAGHLSEATRDALSRRSCREPVF